MEPDPTRPGESRPDPANGAERERVGPFRLLERLGEGGMGVVYLAERRTPVEQRVALKVIRTDRLDKTYRARFAMEQSALARMDHPNIARLLDAGDDRGQSWFAMEYVPGQPLTDYCAEHRLSIEARLRLFAQICDGVQHAHVKGILHRDLKPGNILVREIDGRAVAKIIDFGLAQPVDPLQIRATLHEAMQQIVGTFAYMSPEQATRTEGDLDTRTDVYSLGVVLYELLTGELPIDFDEVKKQGLAWFGDYLRRHEPPRPSTRLSSMGERLSAAAAERCMSPHRLRSCVRGDLDWVTMKALARDRQRRYVTVRELGREVERFLQHVPVEAGPPSAWYSARKWVRRHARAVGVASGVALAATALISMNVMHAAATLRLEREAGLAGEPLVAGGLLEARWRLGIDEASEPAACTWLARAAALLRNEEVQRQRLQRAPDPLLEQYLTVTLPELATAKEDVEEVLAGIAWVREQMQANAATWASCIAEICADARNGIASMPPQFGLVPLGRDPKSRLFEFELLDPRGREEAALDRRVRRGGDGALEFGLHGDAVLVLLPGGTFVMGTDPVDEPWYDADAARAERPAHEVMLSPFLLGKYELTQMQNSPYEGENPSFWRELTFARRQQELRDAKIPTDIGKTRMAGKRGMPVGDLSWFEANRLARHLGVRLPGEAEWEYGARGGTSGPWSCDAAESELRLHANCADCMGEVTRLPLNARKGVWFVGSDGVGAPAPVGLFAPNAFGLHDVHGNVYEWCADPLLDYDASGLADSPGTQRKRVLRGGSFQSPLQDTRCAARREASLYSSARDFGVRIARDLVGCTLR